jgi:hypothetical protein
LLVDFSIPSLLFPSSGKILSVGFLASFAILSHPFALYCHCGHPISSSNQILLTRLVVSSEIDVYKPAKRVLMKRGGTKYSAYERTSPGDFGPAEQANKANKRGSLAHA